MMRQPYLIELAFTLCAVLLQCRSGLCDNGWIIKLIFRFLRNYPLIISHWYCLDLKTNVVYFLCGVFFNIQDWPTEVFNQTKYVLNNAFTNAPFYVTNFDVYIIKKDR